MRRATPSRSAVRLLVVAALVALLGAGATLGQTKIGELEWISLGSPHPYTPDLDLGAREWQVYYAGATYIRVHFSQFDLAPGDFIEVTDLSGQTVHRYDGKGPHGNGSFWAFVVPGDMARIRLHASVGYGHGFEIDSFGRGIVEIFDPGTDSVCGQNDWQDVKCFQSSDPNKYEAARGAVKAIIGCCSSCTAFKVSDDGQFMTNNHCTNTQSGVQSTQLQMEYQNASCGGGGSGDNGSVNGSSLVQTDYTLDYTLMTSTGNSSAIPCLQLDARLPPVGEQIYIAHHPSGGVKKLSIDSDQNNPSGLCQVDVSPIAGRDPTSDVGYLCDTTNGSSGSPVLAASNHEVIAIHHFGGCYNSGVRMDRIVPQLGNKLNTCSVTIGEPGGGPVCLSKGSSCSSDSECCSNKCRGKRGNKNCK